MKLSDKILRLRKQHGMSQEDLAEKLCVSRQAISRWEVGSAQPDASNVLQLSRLFGVTADYLLNDDYERDLDIPTVRNLEISARHKIKKIIALCVSALGLLGNFVIYLLSRFIKVAVPHIRYENGVKMYQWNGTGYSYGFFIQEHNLEFLTAVFWILFVVGLAVAFVNREKLKETVAKHKKRWHRNSKRDCSEPKN